MPTNSDELTNRLKQLSSVEWVDIRNQLDAWHMLSQVGERKQQLNVQLGADYLTGIAHELRRRKLGGNLTGLTRTLQVASLKKVDAAWSQLLRLAPKKLSVVEQTHLAKIAAFQLARYLERGGVPVSPKTMCNNADKTILALDAAFPGYIGAGLMSFILRTNNGRRER